MESEILSAKDVAEMLHQDPESVTQLFESKSLPGRKIGLHWYTTRRQLVEFIEGKVAASPPPAAAAESLDRTNAALARQRRNPNTWTCVGCGAKNDPERVMCRVCKSVRETPLINYRPKH